MKASGSPGFFLLVTGFPLGVSGIGSPLSIQNVVEGNHRHVGSLSNARRGHKAGGRAWT